MLDAISVAVRFSCHRCTDLDERLLDEPRLNYWLSLYAGVQDLLDSPNELSPAQQDAYHIYINNRQECAPLL